MAYEAKIVLDSVGPNGARLTTFELTYPRFVHAELLTHRMFSRNSASSRAIPTEKLMGRVREDPVLPVFWGKNQGGMQARAELNGVEVYDVRREWLAGRDMMVELSGKMSRIGLHKQIANRVVEPWMFITVLVTATEFSNFFGLRDHGDAQPELADVAGKAHRLYEKNDPQELASGKWHLPLVTGRDAEELARDGFTDDRMCMISIGRCARVSYLTHEGMRAPDEDVTRYLKCVEPGHMSPLEHVAMALTIEDWRRYARAMAVEWIEQRVPIGNLWGWMQYRKTIPLEHDFSKLPRKT